jgi:predicted PurR-regulated permease PerM
VTPGWDTPGPEQFGATTPPAEPSGFGGGASEISGSTPVGLPVQGGRTWRRFARLWGFALFIAIIVYFFREVLLPFILAITIAYILAPAVDRLAAIRFGSRRMPRGAAVLLCYVVLVGILALFFGLFLPRLMNDFARLGKEAPKLWTRIQKEWTPAVAGWLEDRFPALAPEQTAKLEDDPASFSTELSSPPGTVFRVTPLADGDLVVSLPETGIEVTHLDDGHLVVRPGKEVKPKTLTDVLRERMMKAIAGLEGEIAGLLKGLQTLVTGIITLFMQIIIVLMVAAFLLVDVNRIHGFARSLVPGRYHRDYDMIVTGVDRGLSGVIRGQLLVCLINGVLTYIGMVIFDVNYGFLLAVFAGVMSLIPIFGTVISSLPIVAIAMVSRPDGVDLVRGAFILLWILGIHFIEANFLSPKIMGSAAKMHPVVVIFALIAGEHTYGLAGALLAVPVASIIQTVFLYIRGRTWKLEPSGPI